MSSRYTRRCQTLATTASRADSNATLTAYVATYEAHFRLNSRKSPTALNSDWLEVCAGFKWILPGEPAAA